jgi:hypothetical protein
MIDMLPIGAWFERFLSPVRASYWLPTMSRRMSIEALCMRETELVLLEATNGLRAGNNGWRQSDNEEVQKG